VEQPEDAWPIQVANSLHDGPMQTVVSVTLELDGLARAVGSDSPPPADELRGTLERLHAAGQQATREIRAVVRALSDGGDGFATVAAGVVSGGAQAYGSGDPRGEGAGAVKAASGEVAS
jgi:hypothetical protein